MVVFFWGGGVNIRGSVNKRGGFDKRGVWQGFIPFSQVFPGVHQNSIPQKCVSDVFVLAEAPRAALNGTQNAGCMKILPGLLEGKKIVTSKNDVC